MKKARPIYNRLVCVLRGHNDHRVYKTETVTGWDGQDRKVQLREFYDCCQRCGQRLV